MTAFAELPPNVRRSLAQCPGCAMAVNKARQNLYEEVSPDGEIIRVSGKAERCVWCDLSVTVEQRPRPFSNQHDEQINVFGLEDDSQESSNCLR